MHSEGFSDEWFEVHYQSPYMNTGVNTGVCPTNNLICRCGIENCKGHAMGYTAVVSCHCGIENCKGHPMYTTACGVKGHPIQTK